MTPSNLVNLKAIPLVRRLEYLEVFLTGVKRGSQRKELMVALGERKKAFEIEKDLALGRGNPHRKDITEATRLLKYCIKLARDMKFVDRTGSTPRLLETGKDTRRCMFAEAFSEAYPHLATVVSALSHLDGEEAILPLMNQPEFEPEAAKYGFSLGQMYFDTVRDIGTRLGLINWYVSGVGSERRQHVYLTCQLTREDPGSFLVKIHSNESWLYAVSFEVERNRFRESLWDSYLILADGVPGSPVFYSSVREKVCAAIKLRDDQFDNEVMRMVDWDEMLHVIWSEGVLQYQKDSASMLKSLPPKNEWGRYVVYLKMVRR
jgi:hypothetical protein